MKNLYLRLVTTIITVHLLLWMGTVSAKQISFEEISEETKTECKGKLKGKRVTLKNLQEVFKKHESWCKDYRTLDDKSKEVMTDPRRANLCGANLEGINLSDYDLEFVDLSGAKLLETTLKKAQSANLSGTDLGLAILSGARLVDANLRGAFLSGADLSGANLVGADLAYAWLDDANVKDAIFEPTDLPDIDGIASAKNLSRMTFKDSPQALYKLRRAFKEAGYYRQERMVTYAIKHQEMLRLFGNQNFCGLQMASLLEGAFNYLFFDLTTKWGMNPGRALVILLVLIPFFAISYVITLRLHGPNGIWLIWADDSKYFNGRIKEPIRLICRWPKAIYLGLYFSLLSAFNIGWREFNIGNWIQRLQAKEYNLKATGWVRTVSGVQSLISVYLLAIWALTYFGRPFE